MRKLLAGAMAVCLSVSAFADADFRITEAYTGVSGDDGTPDWFELTNFGDMAGSTNGFYYDDSSADPTNDFALPNFSVKPGESIIVLIEGEAADVPAFYSFWGLATIDVQVGLTGGGALGQGGDQVNVFDGNSAGANLIDSLTYDGGLAGTAATIEDATGSGPLTNSALGVNGAFQSAGSAAVGQLIGSPGVIPEPTSLALLAIAGLFSGRRR